MERKNILAHRGIWSEPCQRNSRQSLSKALQEGFGLETDIRDLDGRLVIAHDPPRLSNYLPLDWLLDFYVANRCQGVLALNIKADGLAIEIAKQLKKRDITTAFVFDMSIPDTLSYIKYKIPFFSRVSEYEHEPALETKCSGIWVDSFNGDFPQVQRMKSLQSQGKPCVLVSPELHGRNHLEIWHEFKASGLAESEHSLICTDFPEEAVDFFGEVRQ